MNLYLFINKNPSWAWAAKCIVAAETIGEARELVNHRPPNRPNCNKWTYTILSKTTQSGVRAGILMYRC